VRAVISGARGLAAEAGVSAADIQEAAVRVHVRKALESGRVVPVRAYRRVLRANAWLCCAVGVMGATILSLVFTRG
jgi:hypothetical protein